MEAGATSGTVDYTLVLPPTIVNIPQSGAVNEVDKSSCGIDFQGPETERFRSLYAKEFVELRSLCKLEETTFFNSLKAFEKWDAKGGKSNASFSKTVDNCFIMKKISEKEFRSFVDHIAERYFEYLKTSLSSDHQTCLAKIFGVYEVTNALQHKQYWIIMENLLAGREIEVTYDLKGKFGRQIDLNIDLEKAKDLEEAKNVRIEEDFVQDSIYISQASKKILQIALLRDTKFLNDVNVMDYSLLMGVDEKNLEIICGIIDYLGPYDISKKIEWIAKSLMMACTCTNQEPTVMNPSDYKRRFTTFMEREFKCNLE